MNYLILVRHGESRWNLSNKFTGWVDVPLSEAGVKEANQCANQLENLELDIAYTSHLSRAQSTLQLILSRQYYTGYFVHSEDKKNHRKYLPRRINKEDIPIYESADLNERYYGQLQGMNKAYAKKKYGEEQVFKWRRGFKHRPPGGESLKDTFERVVPYFKKKVLKSIREKQNVIVAAHGNSLRAMIMHIEKMDAEQVPNLELPTGTAIVYKYYRKKLVRISGDATFDRPLEWGNKK